MSNNPLLTRDVPMWDVVVEAHTIVSKTGIRYEIARLEYRTGGTKSADQARKWAVQETHRRASVPPWRPYIRESMEHARVTRYMEQVV